MGVPSKSGREIFEGDLTDQLNCKKYWWISSVHTIRFVKKFHSIGLFNEQAIESLHQIMHTDEKKYIHLNKMPVIKVKCLMDQQNIRACLS